MVAIFAEWSGGTVVAVIICLISTLRLAYWHLFKREQALAKEQASNGPPSAEDNGGLPHGPKGWPFVGNLLALGHEPHRALADLAQIYGDVLQIHLGSFPTVVVSSMSLAKEVLVKQAAQFSSTGEPIRIVEVALRWIPAHFKATNSGALDTVICSALKAADRSGAVREAIRRGSIAVVSTVEDELGDAGKAGSVRGCQVTGLRAILRRAALGILLDVGFGVRLSREGGGSDESGERSSSLGLLEVVLSEMWQLVNTAVLADCVTLLRGATGALTTRCRFLGRQRDRILRDLVKEAKEARGKAEEHGGSLVESLLDAQESSGVSNGEVADALADFVQRGVLPVSATVEWVLAELTRHPQVQTKLRNELEAEQFGKEGKAPRQALVRAPLLAAVILESLRLHPTRPLCGPFTALADIDLGGYSVTQGQCVLINAWALGRDARSFASPTVFLPDRFSSDPVHSLLDAKDLYWNAMSSDRTALLLDATAHLLGALVHRFEWLSTPMHDARVPLRESPGVEVLEPGSGVTVSARIR